MASLNVAQIIGNLGRDPEVRTTASGAKVVNLTIATSERWKDKTTGESKEKTEWHNIVIFNDRIGDVAERFLKKGKQVYVSGQLQTRKWTDKEGKDRYTTEIVIGQYRGELVLLGDAPREGGATPAHSPAADKLAASTKGNWAPPPSGDLDDEIPF